VTHFLAVVERQWRLRMLLARGEHEAVRSALPDPEAGAQACSLAARLCLARTMRRALSRRSSPR
jgi:hypothetical protein